MNEQMVELDLLDQWFPSFSVRQDLLRGLLTHEQLRPTLLFDSSVGRSLNRHRWQVPGDVDAGLGTKLCSIKFEEPCSRLQHEKWPVDGAIIELKPPLGAVGNGWVLGSASWKASCPKHVFQDGGGVEGELWPGRLICRAESWRKHWEQLGWGRIGSSLTTTISFHCWFPSKEGSDLFLHCVSAWPAARSNSIHHSKVKISPLKNSL